jgi:hypothetical protein
MTIRNAWKADTEIGTDIQKLMGTQTHRHTESMVVA